MSDTPTYPKVNTHQMHVFRSIFLCALCVPLAMLETRVDHSLVAVDLVLAQLDHKIPLRAISNPAPTSIFQKQFQQGSNKIRISMISIILNKIIYNITIPWSRI